MKGIFSEWISRKIGRSLKQLVPKIPTVILNPYQATTLLHLVSFGITLLIYNRIQSFYSIRSYLNESNLELKYTILKVNNHWRELHFQLLFHVKIKYTILNILTELLRFYRSISRKGVLFYFGKKCQFIKTSFRDRKIDFIGHSPEKIAIRFFGHSFAWSPIEG